MGGVGWDLMELAHGHNIASYIRAQPTHTHTNTVFYDLRITVPFLYIYDLRLAIDGRFDKLRVAMPTHKASPASWVWWGGVR